MALSAAERLFSIPELLEPILVQMIDEAPERFTHFFTFQCVNRSIRNNILNSPVLRRRMGLDYIPSEKTIIPSPAFATFLDRHDSHI